MLTREQRQAMPTPTSFYEAFTSELDALTIMADAPAAAVLGECTRAAKRAQMWLDGDYDSSEVEA